MANEIEEEESLLRIREAARILSISPSKLYVLIKRNEVPHVRIGGCWRCTLDDRRGVSRTNAASLGNVQQEPKKRLVYTE